jgi:hypothetical protein
MKRLFHEPLIYFLALDAVLRDYQTAQRDELDRRTVEEFKARSRISEDVPDRPLRHRRCGGVLVRRACFELLIDGAPIEIRLRLRSSLGCLRSLRPSPRFRFAPGAPGLARGRLFCGP